MQNHFSTWSTKLAADYRAEFQEQLQRLERVLSKADDGTPRAMRETELRHIASTQAGHDTAMVALQCATVCRDSNADDFSALCAVMKILIKGEFSACEVELQRLLEFLAESDRIATDVMPVDEVIGQVERMVAGQRTPAEWRPLLESIRQTVDCSIQEKTKSIDSLLARIDRLREDSVAARLKADDGWADQAREDLSLLNEADRRKWDAILRHASTVLPEPPAKDWDVDPDEIHVDVMDAEAHAREHDRHFLSREAAREWITMTHELIAAIGAERFEAARLKWLQAVPD